MSLFQRSAHADAWPENSWAQPPLAAACDAEIADCSGAEEVSAVSTPTNLVNSYDVPLRAANVTPWLAVRSCALLVDELEVGWTAVLTSGATAPPWPVPVLNATPTVRAPLTARPPVWVTRRARAPSMTSVTVAPPL